MKNILKKTAKHFLITAMIILLTAVSTVSVIAISGEKAVQAENKYYDDYFKGYKNFASYELDELYNQTNTYRYTGLNENNQAYYDVSDSGRNNIKVSDEAPQITERSFFL